MRPRIAKFPYENDGPSGKITCPRSHDQPGADCLLVYSLPEHLRFKIFLMKSSIG